VSNSLDSTMTTALAGKPEVAALACMDGRAGLVIGMYVRGDVPRDLVEIAALSAPQICSAPRAGTHDDEDEGCPEAFVASDSWVHAFARVPNRPDLVVMGVAQHGTNVTLLRAWVGEVAGQVGRVP
jgi:hypothetical protein